MKSSLISALKALPLIRFALMLGGGVIASIAAGHVQIWLAHGSFPNVEAVWLARIQGATWMGLGALMIIMVVMVTLAWGKVTGAKISSQYVTAELGFDEPEKPE